MRKADDISKFPWFWVAGEPCFSVPLYDIGRKAASPKETRKTFTTMSRPVKTDLETHPQDIQTISESYVKTNANMFIKKMQV